MPVEKVDALYELENVLHMEAQSHNFLTSSDKRELQLAAMRAWPRYQCLEQIYLERCRSAGRVPKLPNIARPTLIEGGVLQPKEFRSGREK